MVLVCVTGCSREEPASAQGDGSGPAGFAPVSLEEVLRIPSSPASAEPVFHRVSGAVISSSGEEIYVVDRYGPSVRVFDRGGALLREFGRAGEGPGEFRDPRGVRLVGEEVHVPDTRLLRFTRAGRSAGMREPESGAVEGGIFRRVPHALVRYDQVLGLAEISSGLDPSARRLVLVDAEDREVEALFRDELGHVRVRLRSRPERFTSTSGLEFFGSEVSWDVSGDSVLVRVDNFTGRVEWHRIERGHLRLIRTRDLELPLIPVPLTEDEVRRHEAERRGVPASEIIEVDLPRYEAYFEGARIDSGLDVWLRWRSRDAPEGEAGPARLLTVPFDLARPVREVELPMDLHFLSAEGELLVGRRTDPVTGVQSVRMYRVRP